MIMDRLDKKQNAGRDPKNIAAYKAELDKEREKEEELEKTKKGLKDAVEKKEKMMAERQKATAARLIKAETDRLQADGGVVDMVIGAITTNIKKQNKAAEKNNTVRETINDIATAKDDAMNVTRSSLHGALHEWKKQNKTKVDNATKDITAE